MRLAPWRWWPPLPPASSCGRRFQTAVGCPVCCREYTTTSLLSTGHRPLNHSLAQAHNHFTTRAQKPMGYPSSWERHSINGDVKRRAAAFAFGGQPVAALPEEQGRAIWDLQ